MIRNLAQCPFCQRCEVALNDNLEVVFNPGAAPAEPCAHLVYVQGGYSQWELKPLPGRKTMLPRMTGSTEFEWQHQGLASEEEPERLPNFLKDLVNAGSQWEFAPQQPHVIRPISLDQSIRGPDGKEHPSWEVEGAAVFARDAGGFIDELPACQARQSSVWGESSGFPPA
jgi:hypothetical protein